MPILSLIIFTPIVGALLVGLLPAEPLQIPRRAAFAFSLIRVVAHHAGHVPGRRRRPAVGREGGVDPEPGRVLLARRRRFLALGWWCRPRCSPSIILAAWGDIEKHCKQFMMLILALEG
ncbi:MAG: hypothetical protein U0802_06220 [Candidatus Binatia bacterium]